MILSHIDSKIVLFTHGMILTGESMADMNALLIELFDEMTDLYGEDKVKTVIGNAYECAFMEVLKND